MRCFAQKNKQIISYIKKFFINNWGGNEINLEGPWKRISMTDAIKEQTGIDFRKEIILATCG